MRSWLALVRLLAQPSPNAPAANTPSAPFARASCFQLRPTPQTAGRRELLLQLLRRDGRAGSA